ncbi:hypothetical protein C8R43DRAFT_998177 [Mycena crocata]|nr:hypothetical protein C8R43DRAFT_1042561 [Mycena crocata]KAJ7156428.1 hypothetical protein C8R43DRAFT_998177 [Mycena crocata]
MYGNAPFYYGHAGPPGPVEDEDNPGSSAQAHLRMHQQQLGLGPAPHPRTHLSRAPSFDAARGHPHQPYIQRAVSGALPAIYDQPDPAMLNQYVDRGLQPPRPSSQTAPDITTMLSSLNLRQDHLHDQLTSQNQLLSETNAALQARLELLESTRPPTHPGSVSTRAASTAMRGGKKRVPSVHTVPQLHSVDPTLPAPVVDNSDLPSLGDVTKLSDSQKQTRLALKRRVGATFRDICGVGKSTDSWPDSDVQRVNEITGVPYENPDFESGVTDVRNIHIFTVVAKQLANEFEDVECQPEGLATCGATWDLDLLKNMSKEAFPNFKKQWKVAHDAAAKQRKDANDRTNRQRARRVLKAEQHRKVAAKHVTQNDLRVSASDLRELMFEDHMSDEASGPEDESQETPANWKRRMARASGHGDSSASALAQLTFVEVLDTDWRSVEFSELNLGLHNTWWGTLTSQQKAQIKLIRVRGTGRRSSRIPKFAPYNFAISQPWLDRHRLDPLYADFLSDWNNHPGPPGFDTADDLVEGTSSHTTVPDSVPIDPSFDS